MIQHRSVVFISLLLLSLAAAADPLSSNADCPYEPLPTDFNSLTYLGFNEEFHLQNTFFYDFESFSRDITFSVKQQSEFRIYIAPHVVDIDIWLYDTKQSSSLKHTFDIGGDEVITYTLPAGDYRIRLLFFGIYYISGVSCPTINMEVSIVPSARLASRVASYNCPSSELAPSIDLTSLGRQDKFYYNSDMNSSSIYNVRNNQSSGEVAENTYRFVTSYKFSLTGAANADAYSFTARIGTNFLIGGSLGLLLQSQADPTPTDLSCLSSFNCSMGVHVSQNENTLTTVLAPGDYVLWLFDSLYEKNSSLSKCIPYSMEIDVRHAEQVAGFLNCPGQSLPPLLNVPGIFDDDGFMYYRQDILVDLTVQQASSVFKVSAPSVFRAYTSEHRLDIDLKLLNKDTGRVVVSTYRWFGEEGLITPLEANVNYEFVVVFFGRYEQLFCETFLLELAVAPTSSFSNVNSTVCSGSKNLPSLSGMSSLITSPYTYSLSNSTYLFDYENDYSQRTIVSQSFTITTSSTLKINLGSNFLLGDIRFTVTAIRGGDETNSTMIGRHMRNNHFFAELLTPGQYKLDIATGVSQTSTQPGGFPSCSAFTLSIDVAPTTSTSTSCIQARSFPTSFNTPEFLGTSSKIHIQETFLMPLSLATRLSATEEAYFTVDVISFFRLYLEPNHIDIDVVLYENGTQVASETSFNDEEAIAWVAKPATTYRILLRYYHWFFGNHDNDAPCYFSAIEMAISPMSTYGGTFCTEDTQPPAPLFATVNKTETVTQGTFHFSQERDSKKITIPFTIPSGSALFRAVLTYDFIWNDLALALYNNASGRLSQITAGSIEYNQNEIATRLLPAGQYALQIYEPFPTTMTGQFALRNCVPYVLQTAIQIVDGSSINPTQTCAGVSFPPATLDSIAYISNLTENIVHISREILVDVMAQTDAFQFTVITPSVFRMHVPAHDSVDVDLYLRRGTIASPGELLDSQFSYGEEIIYRQLQPGQYMVKLYYYGFGQQLPSSDECPSYFATIALYPLSYLQAIPALSQPCGQADVVPAHLVGGQPFNGTFHRSLESWHWSTTISFTTTTVSQLVTNLRFDDASGGLSLRLDGYITDGNVQVNKSYSALYEKNHAYLNEILRPGTYSIVIYDPTTANAAPTLLCSAFGLDYMLNTSTVPLPNECSDLQTLPTDLSTTSGGSVPYGGPQAADGSIQIFGYKFYMSKDSSKKHNYIKFMVPSETLYFRVYASSDSTNDIDFYLYRNATDLLGSLYKSSIGWDSTENAIWTLPPQPNPYLLDVSFYKINSAIDCNYFHFEIVARTNSTIREELLCPVPLPNEVDQVPPESIRFLAGEDYSVYNQNYVFTSERVNLNTVLGQFRYRMTLRAETNVTMTAKLGYDFLANDYQLILRDSQGRMILQGVADGADSRNSYIDFYNELEASLAPGTYYLDIVEEVFAKNWGLNTYCHYFSFQLTGASVGPATPPHIVSVSPASGSDLDPTAPLVLTIEFSNRLNGSITASYITASNAAFLSSYGAGRLYPTYATVDTSLRNLELTFNGPFTDGGLYSLALDASKFTTLNGSVFGPEEGYARAHYYTMHSCYCSGRGHCERTSSSWKCICDDPWAGDDCSKCKPGTHAAADTCVADQECSPSSCNNHGYCDDSTGFINCYCHYGFDSANDSFCNVCAVGFENYPNCTAISDIDRGTSCTAPLIPTDLNGLAFLGFDGNMHIQGYYYVDLNVAAHDTLFTLKQESVFRSHTEPSWVDIDMWLYRILADGSEEIVQFNYNFNQEETIFQTLLPGNYKLRFKYFDWSTGRNGDCETFNLEIAIHTLTATKKEVNDLRSKCSGSSQLPSISKLGNISTAYTYTTPDNTYFTINDFTNSTGPYYVHNISFEIAATGTQVAVLEANIASRFAWGSVALLLEQGAKNTHCDNTGFNWGQSDNPGCAYGDNYLNHNYLKQTLRNGAYTLWIYEPTRQNYTISTCAAFEFSLAINFVDDTSDVYTCRGSFLPSSLESSVYTSTDGFVHLSDEYLLVDEHSSMTFSVTQRSLFRVGTQGKAGILLALTNADTGAGIDAGTHTDEDPTLFAELPAGKYRLLLGITGGQTCPSVFLELAIEPVLETRVPAACANLTTDVLPAIATPLQMPYEFSEPTRAYYTRNSDNNLNVAAYSFYLSSAANLHTSVSSDFLRSDLRVHLYLDNRLVVVGKRDYNHNDIRARLEPGNYTAKIVRPPIGVTNRFIPSCSEFNFELSVRYVSSSSDVLCQGTSMPASLNTMRFLGLEDRFAYQSDSFLIPVSSRIYEFKSTSLMVANNSLIRVYTEPHSVDIDVKLIQNSNYKVVAQGSNGIGTEEALSFVLQAGVNYTLQLQYWFWTQVTEPCPTFNLGFAVGPVVPLTKTCPNSGASHWPADLPSTMPSTFSYSSIDKAEHLYFQEAITTLASKTYSFRLTNAGNLHVELGFNFLYGSIVLKLKSVATGNIYYGTNEPNKNSLTRMNLPAGEYELTIYQPVANVVEVMGCVDFTFEILVEPYTTFVDAVHGAHVPSTLNSLAYLALEPSTHIQGTYTMFDGLYRESITFAVPSTSLLRVEAIAALEENASVLQKSLIAPMVTLKGPSPSAGFGFLLHSLNAGTYTLEFNATQPMGNPEGGVPIAFELAVRTVSALQSDLATYNAVYPDSCQDSVIKPIVVSPTGYYSYHADAVSVSYDTIISRDASEPLFVLPFQVSIETRLYAQLGFNFLLDELYMVLRSVDGIQSVEIYGRGFKNLNELNQILPAGRYELSIFQPTKFEAPVELKHCAEFSFSITIQDASIGNHADCSSFDVVPWELNNAAGPSAAFGGPIDSTGYLHLYSKSFLMSSSRKDTISFQVQNDVILSLFAASPYGDSVTDFALSSNGVTQQPLFNTLGYNQERLTLFSLPRGTYSLELTYRGSSGSVACPSLELLINMRSRTLLSKEVTCPSSSYLSALPEPIQFREDFACQHVESLFTSAIYNTNTFPYTMKFVAPTRGRFLATLSFNSLTSYFDLKLSSSYTYGSGSPFTYNVASGAFQAQSQRSGSTTLTESLSAYLSEGQNYTLTIEVPPSFASSAPLNSYNNTCLPFLWSLIFVPETSSRPFVSNVLPSSAFDLDPNDNFTMLLQLSKTVYSGTPLVSIKKTDGAIIALSFYLEGNDGSIHHPDMAISMNANALDWSLVFFGSKLASASTYTLKLAPNRLSGNGSSPLWLGCGYVYSTVDLACSNHGHYNVEESRCICDSGYAGVACGVCDTGYTDATKGSGLLNCVLSTNGCTKTTCGMIGDTPLGICKEDASGRAVCYCDTAHAGPRCEFCAANRSQSTYPACDLHVQCPACVHGEECDFSTGKCRCEQNYIGDACEACAPDWSGKDCLEHNSGGHWDATTAFLEIAGIILFVGAISAGIVWYFKKRRATGSRYKSLPRFDEDDDQGTSFPAFDNTLMDDDEPDVSSPHTPLTALARPAPGPLSLNADQSNTPRSRPLMDL